MDNDCKCGNEGDCCQEQEQQFPDWWLNSPFVKDGDLLPMGVASYEGKMYMGEVLDKRPDQVVLGNPLLVVAQVRMDPNTQQVEQSQSIMPMPLGNPREIVLPGCFFYFLDKEKTQDRNLVEGYFNAHKQFQANESGIVTPSNEDLIQLHRG